jgi:putative ABC transport system permease protein
VIAAFAVGIPVTVAAARIPARRAAKIAPVAALRDAEAPDRPLTRRTIGGVLLLLLGVAGMTAGLTGNGLLGLVVGAVFGVALQRALVNQGVTELRFPFVQLIAYLLVAAVAGVIAAWLPARRASRLNVLNAIAAEYAALVVARAPVRGPTHSLLSGRRSTLLRGGGR